MSTWGDVAKGDRVQLGARVLTVTKAKRKGKKVRVVISDKLGTFDREVKAKGAVTIVPLTKLGDGRVGGESLHDRHGAQQRWAKDADVEFGGTRDEWIQETGSKLEGPHHGSPWETPADKTEKTLQRILGATLVEESIDGGRTYAVPPVDYGTVAAHLLIMHGVDPSQWGEIAAMLQGHNELHDLNRDMKVPHYHSETRP